MALKVKTRPRTHDTRAKRSTAVNNSMILFYIIMIHYYFWSYKHNDVCLLIQKISLKALYIAEKL